MHKRLGLTFLLSAVAVGGMSLLSLPSLYPIVIPAEYDTPYNKAINSSIEYVFLYDEISAEGARITVQSNATEQDPLVVVIRQRSGILSWQIPFIVQNAHSENLRYDSTSRTLCSTKGKKNNTDEEFITVSISTGSHGNISFQLTISQEDFTIRLGDLKNVTISPAEPIYYGYNFTDEKESSSVLVQVESDSDICMTISIQHTSCPVFDLERNVQYSGYWQTVSRRGGITISREAYPRGFFVVLVVKGDDTDCTGTIGYPDRQKTLKLFINPSISKEDFITASTIAFSCGVGFCAIYIIGVVMHRVRQGRKQREQLLSDHLEECEQPEHLPSPSTVEEAGPSQWTSVEEDSSLDEDDIDMMDDALTDKEIIRTKRVLSVSDLARKEPKILRHKSRLYLYYLITIAVFYALPVMQLVITYQNVLHVTGNQDLCYYNFLCAHPLGLLSDFNHVFSNFGYILLGLLFIFLTYTRENINVDGAEKSKSYGIPQHYGLFYAMGTALMMEGLLSGSYHVCPNHSNFQFDTSFMYIISVLCMVKIYQTRHPDINARASVTFGVLALIIFLGMVGVLNGTKDFWIIFTMVHLIVCIVLTAQIYYMGRWRLNRGLFRRVFMTLKHDARAGRFDVLRPLYRGRLMLLLLANSCNVGLAVYGNMHHDKDFATFLLAILMSNLLLYTFFYITMKLCHREKILIEPMCYIILSFVTWGGALYFFIHKSVSWALTPAQSRLYNKPCALLNFFDSHDIWHFLSALAMFFSFMVLLTLDDDLEDTHRSLIPVF